MYNIAVTDNGSMLFRGTDAIGGAAIKKKNLKQRKNITDPIQELMGLITDPYSNIEKTMRVQASLLQTARAQSQLLEHGLGEKYMKVLDGDDVPRGWHKLEGERYKYYEKKNIIIKDEAKKVLEAYNQTQSDNGNSFAKNFENEYLYQEGYDCS